ncbi:hypothetical protein NNC19_03375 [Clostridium sp. SHJSY1]|uniref:hypothetical protein n=1 Tax=Clostridium sp. SHJSY1 TaxID=2942483 RepID=UPI002876F466|nr:hypothetical protein [Clostridium sp. SHJSY1]MDS0524706.1 hypothetical protein [Clostridium sp. SHJSY1]
MSDLLYKLLVFIIPLGLGEFIYLKMDRKYDVTNRISKKLPIQDKWKALFCFSCVFIIMLVIWIIDISYTISSIVNGFLAGIGIIMSNKMSIKTNRF